MPVLEVARHPSGRRARVLATLMRWLVRPAMTHWPLRGRWLAALALIDRAAGFGGRPRGARVTRLVVGDCPAELVHGRGVDRRDRVILYLHGGAFVMCGLNTHRPLVARVSEAARAPVLNLGYRHLPATDLAGSVADCLAGYRWLLDVGWRPEQIIVAGDSAGGHLAVALVTRLLAEGLPRPAGVVALSPWLDLDCAAKLAHENAATDAYIPASRMGHVAGLLFATPDPMHSPVNADLRDFPPVLLQVSSTEVLLCDAELMAERLAVSGVPTRLEIWEDQVHVFQAFARLVPEARAAIGSIGEFARAVTGGARSAAA